jgi:hypothetical protein
MINTLISSFNAGELSPYIQDRVSMDKYKNGCQTMENMVPTIYGTAHRRPGTEYLGTAALSTSRSRLYGLNFTDTDRVVMEIAVGSIRFWRSGQLISGATAAPVDYAGNAYSSAYPVPAGFWYTEAELRDISITQINRVIYLAHPNYPPYRISYYSDSNITIGEVPFKYAPMMDVNTTSTTITPSAKIGSITLTASASIFNSNHVGAYFQLSHFNPTRYVDIVLNSSSVTTSSTIWIKGDYTVNTFGTWTASLQLQRKGNDGAWYTVKTFNSTKDYNAAYTATEPLGAYYQMIVSNVTANTSASIPRAVLSPVDGTLYGQVRITAVTNGTTATGTVTQSLGDTSATYMWNEGAFSNNNGFPSTVGLFEGRVIYGGTTNQPNTIWGSASSDFQQFLLGANAGDSIAFTLSSVSAGRIKWIIGKSSMIVGTSTDEWAIAGSNGQPLSASNVEAKLQSRYGSASLTPLVVNETLLFFQRGNRKVREMSYSWQVDAWVSPDLTVMAEQATRDGIVERSYTRVPDGTMWIITATGQLVSMVYERDQQIAGFSRHITDGTFESVTTLPGTGGEDEVWVSVLRNINGNNVRYIERLKIGVRTAVESGNKSGWWFSDCATYVSNGSPTSTITGLSQLEGKTVQVWGDNAVVSLAPNSNNSNLYTVYNGTIYLSTPVTSAVIGLPYTSTLTPMRVEQDMQDGTSVGRRSRIPKMKIRVMNSIAGEFSTDNSNWFQMVSRTTSDYMDASPTPQNSFEVLTVSGNWTYTPNITLRQNLPMPLSVVSIVVLWQTSENVAD